MRTQSRSCHWHVRAVPLIAACAPDNHCRVHCKKYNCQFNIFPFNDALDFTFGADTFAPIEFIRASNRAALCPCRSKYANVCHTFEHVPERLVVSVVANSKIPSMLDLRSLCYLHGTEHYKTAITLKFIYVTRWVTLMIRHGTLFPGLNSDILRSICQHLLEPISNCTMPIYVLSLTMQLDVDTHIKNNTARVPCTRYVVDLAAPASVQEAGCFDHCTVVYTQVTKSTELLEFLGQCTSKTTAIKQKTQKPFAQPQTQTNAACP